MTILALAGRKGSGKSTLSRFLIESEKYVKISFADFLKNLISDVFLIDKKYLYDQTLKETKCLKIYTNIDFYKKISSYIKEDVTYLLKEEIFIETPRKLLQFVGTDVLRAHDTDFHVKKTLLEIQNSPGVNFVCDDLRFQNELLGLKSLGAEEYFLIRPDNWDISNHSSETSLQWFDLKNIIINNNSVNFLIENFKKRNQTQNLIVFSNAGIKPILQFDITAAVPNDAFIGGFICAHKEKNNLKKLELNSIKNNLSELSEKIDYLNNFTKLENLKIWLDPLNPPSSYFESWQRGRNYYSFLKSDNSFNY
jgi:hypothetical protein